MENILREDQFKSWALIALFLTVAILPNNIGLEHTTITDPSLSINTIAYFQPGHIFFF